MKANKHFINLFNIGFNYRKKIIYKLILILIYKSIEF